MKKYFVIEIKSSHDEEFITDITAFDWINQARQCRDSDRNGSSRHLLVLENNELSVED